MSSSSNITLGETGAVFVDGSKAISATAKSEGTAKVTVTAVDAVTTGAEPEEVSGGYRPVEQGS